MDTDALDAAIRKLNRDIKAAMAANYEAMAQTTFVLLDMVAALTPVEDREPVSWEVERERFMRGLPGYDPRSES